MRTVVRAVKGEKMATGERWGVWRSDGEWLRQRGTRAPWEAKDEADARREADEMNALYKATASEDDLEGPFVYVARPLPASRT